MWRPFDHSARRPKDVQIHDDRDDRSSATRGGMATGVTDPGDCEQHGPAHQDGARQARRQRQAAHEAEQAKAPASGAHPDVNVSALASVIAVPSPSTVKALKPIAPSDAAERHDHQGDRPDGKLGMMRDTEAGMNGAEPPREVAGGGHRVGGAADAGDERQEHAERGRERRRRARRP